MTILVTAILTPAAGKADRLQEILLRHADHVEKHELGCLQYEITVEEKNGGAFVVREQYMDEAALKEHTESPLMVVLGKALGDEALLEGAPAAYQTKLVGGVATRV
ncbi:hypothetical protein SEUCBS139899_009863 [Sporothrix eucalyptigena]|uniref:ABM domain-containing protein n=1 Tax=Sporothrix eucalyptigena TaxID=1812306 RepID=A0ABP0D1M6_9PEZI